MNFSKYRIEWYGHCAFKFSYKNVSFLFDPYDSFQNIEIGYIRADYILVSSIWHDHGNINASSQAHIIAYEGIYDFNKGFKIYGFKAEESRGSQNIIFTILWDDGMCITNFADWGDIDGKSKLDNKALKILSKTKIALMRINYIDKEQDFYCYDLALSVTKPLMIIPIHYFPTKFIKKEIPKNNFFNNEITKQKQVDYMVKKLKYNHKIISGFLFEDSKLPKNPLFLEFSNVHSQVKYKDDKRNRKSIFCNQ